MISFAEARRTLSDAPGPTAPTDVRDPAQHAQHAQHRQHAQHAHQAPPMPRTVSAAELRSLAVGSAMRMATGVNVWFHPASPTVNLR